MIRTKDPKAFPEIFLKDTTKESPMSFLTCPQKKNIYIYIYMHAVESIIGPSLGVFKVNNRAKFVKQNRLCKQNPIK